jgi:hypothetical protein
MGKAKTTASRQVAFVVPQFWFTEPEYGSVRGHLGRKKSQEDLNVTPTYLTHTGNVTLKRGSWIEFKDLSSRLLSEQATMTQKVWLPLPILITTEMHNGNYACHSRSLHLLTAYSSCDPYIFYTFKIGRQWNYFSIQCSPISETAVLYLKVPRLRPLVLLVRVNMQLKLSMKH